MRLLVLIMLCFCIGLSASAQEEYGDLQLSKNEEQVLKETFTKLIDALKKSDIEYIKNNSKKEIYCPVCEWEVDENQPPKHNMISTDTFMKQYKRILPVDSIVYAVAEKRYRHFARKVNGEYLYYFVTHSQRAEQEHANQHHDFMFQHIKSKFVLYGVSSTP